MKKASNLLIALISLCIITFVSCSEDAENKAPEFASISISDNNETVTVIFSENVFANNNKTGDITKDDLTISIPNVDFTYEVTHTAGAKTLTIALTITSITVGSEVITISQSTASSIYDEEGLAMAASESISSDPLDTDKGIIGNWYSAGDNVAPLLVTYFTVDSIYAEFKDDFTYLVEQFNIGNETTTPDVEFTGTFSIVKSTVDEIWTIELTQELPYVANVSGIFEVKTSPETLWYEVVQISGSQNTPPTPELGFGSSTGGAFGVTNIQKFVRIN
ncbi:MAG: hypothetical protein JEZ09_01565 [Salinivirgaceae bacterium]|nr:hypothetical protein [Salinivirgaceae bacterium]